MKKSRRTFIRNTVGISAAALCPAIPSFANNNAIAKGLDPKEVEEFVRVAHSDFDLVKKMLEKTPNLLNTSHDWGNGDFETALGAAGHMGLENVIDYLVAKGSGLDIFILTFLGKTNMVNDLLTEFSGLLHSKGPHGFTLLHYAKLGGNRSKVLYDSFIEKGLEVTIVKDLFKQY